MDNLKLGQIIDGEQSRDAVHIAVAPVIADEALEPGEHIGLTDAGNARARAHFAGKLIGIVDPFLSASVRPGQRFWMFLYPGSITSLRHDWAHPAFTLADARAVVNQPAQSNGSAAETWLREFAERCNLTYRDVIRAGREYAEDGDYFVQHDEESARNEMYSPGVREQFWKNFEIVTGLEISEETREGTVFSCSC